MNSAGRTLLCLGLGIMGAAQAAVYQFKPGMLTAEQEQIVNRTSKNQTAVMKLELKADERLEFAVRLPVKGSFRLRTGRGAEALQLWRKPQGIGWHVWNAKGMLQERPRKHWWENTDYAFNPVVRDSFDFSDELRAWNQYYQAVSYRDPDRTFIPVVLENRKGMLRIYMDHIMLVQLPLQEQPLRLNTVFHIPAGGALTNAAVCRRPALPEHFFSVDLERKFNAAGNPVLPERGKNDLLFFQEIPFELPERRENGQPCADLSQSWFREGTLNSYEEPQNGAFRGRWGGVLANSPTRIQFRIPYRPYTALYVLADCPERPDFAPVITAQFYQPCAGLPQNFTPEQPVRIGNGLQLIRIPVHPSRLQDFSKRNMIELELTGTVHVYKSSPEPFYHSEHGGGRPSGLRVYAVTLETDPVEVRLSPGAFAYVWTEESPVWNVELVNHSDQVQTRKLDVRTRSFHGEEQFSLTETLTVPPRQSVRHSFVLPLQKYGFHTAELTCNSRVYTKQLARVRAREIAQRPFDARGFMFGFWNLDGKHHSIPFRELLRLFTTIGLESCNNSAAWNLRDPENRKLAKKMGFKTFWTFEKGMMQNNPTDEQIRRCFQKALPADDINEPVYVNFFAEPGGLGLGSFPEFFGEERAPMSEKARENLARYKVQLKKMYKAAKAAVPDTKILMPWGSPMFAIPFLEDPETRYLFDGVAYDSGNFERIPEHQIHQCAIHRMVQFRELWKRYRKDDPVMITIEGPSVSPITPGALTKAESANRTLRNSLLLGAYGINRQFSIATSRNSSYWAEQHYGGGATTRIGDTQPEVNYAALATMVRHLRHMEFVRWIPVGSLSTYCLQYRDARDGKLLHVLWTVRGRRRVQMKFTEIYDNMDNLMADPVISPAPVFVYGCDGNIRLEEPDHSDHQLAAVHCRLGNPGQLEFTQTQQADEEYLNQFPSYIRRFPAEMQLDRTPAGLSVVLPPQPKVRKTMPYYTVLELKKPLVIPGRASHLTMRITAHSDWGRVVYVLRDAKGERFISVGQKDTWNCDDMPNQSVFNFDGTRLVRFELPGNLPWDRFRTVGSCWWGHYGGDGDVNLPLSLEKIIVERRTHAVYVNTIEETCRKPVLLGDLYAEYASAADLDILPEVRRPLPETAVRVANPIAELEKTATLPATEILRVDDPPHYYDGTRGIFHFRMVPQAVSYDIYLSLSPSGEGAIRLGRNLKESGRQVNGFRANTTFHAFIIYKDKAGRHSHPSAPFVLKMKDRFGNK